MSCGLVALRFGLPEIGLGAFALRLQRLDLPLGRRERGLGGRDGRLLLAKLRVVLLRALHRAGAGSSQVPGIGRLLLREHQRRLGLLDLRIGSLDLRFLHRDLRVDVVDVGLRRRDLRVRLLERDAIVAVVDAGDHLARG